MTVRDIDEGSATSPVIVRVKFDEHLNRESPGVRANVVKRKRKKMENSETTALSSLDMSGNEKQDEFNGKHEAVHHNRVVTPPVPVKELKYNVVEEEELSHDDMNNAGHSQQNSHFDNVSDLSPVSASSWAPSLCSQSVKDASFSAAPDRPTTLCSNMDKEEETHKKKRHLHEPESDLVGSEAERAALVLHQLHQGHGHPTLAMPDDKVHLNSLHCFVRTHLLEFTSCDSNKNKVVRRYSRKAAKNQKRQYNVARNGSARINVLSDGTQHQQVGLQCVYCAAHEHNKQEEDGNGNGNTQLVQESSAPENSTSSRLKSAIAKDQRASASAFFPKAVDEVYRGVCTWQRTHFPYCPHVPNHIKETYQRLKEEDKSRGKTKYWTDAAHRLGLRDIIKIKGEAHDFDTTKTEDKSAVSTAPDSDSRNPPVKPGAAAPRLGVYFSPFSSC
jgi:hypothetical protein